jgi:hypothetical protein
VTWSGGIDLAPTTRGGDDAAPVEARQCLSRHCYRKLLGGAVLLAVVGLGVPKKKFGKTLLSTALKEAEESKR